MSNTVQQPPEMVLAADVTPGQHIEDLETCRVHKATHVLPFVNGDREPMVAVTLEPLDGGEPFLARYRATALVQPAPTEAVEKAQGDTRRNVLLASLMELVDVIATNKLPVPESYTYPEFTMMLKSRADFVQWAGVLGAPIRAGGTDKNIPLANSTMGTGRALHICVQGPTEPKADPEGWGYSRPAEDDAEPVEPPSEGDHWTPTGRTGNTGEHPIVTPTTAPDATPATHKMVAGWASDACSTSGTAGVECACGTTFYGFDTLGEAVECLDRHIAQPEAHRITTAPEGVETAAVVTPERQNWDRNPTIDARDPLAYDKYAARLDADVPGWYWDNLDRMAPELAQFAGNRRKSDEGGPS